MKSKRSEPPPKIYCFLDLYVTQAPAPAPMQLFLPEPMQLFLPVLAGCKVARNAFRVRRPRGPGTTSRSTEPLGQSFVSDLPVAKKGLRHLWDGLWRGSREDRRMQKFKGSQHAARGDSVPVRWEVDPQGQGGPLFIPKLHSG